MLTEIKHNINIVKCSKNRIKQQLLNTNDPNKCTKNCSTKQIQKSITHTHKNKIPKIWEHNVKNKIKNDNVIKNAGAASLI